MLEKDNILQILKETKKAVKTEDTISLKDLSNRTMHSASIEQDSISITIATIIYSLSKIIEKTKYRKEADWKQFISSINLHIDRALNSLEKNNERRFEKELGKLRKNIAKKSGNLKSIIYDVFKKASINKASRIYEHGISMEKTARLLGLSLWDLAEYAGQQVKDVNLTVTLDVKERVKNAQEIFS